MISRASIIPQVGVQCHGGQLPDDGLRCKEVVPPAGRTTLFGKYGAFETLTDLSPACYLGQGYVKGTPLTGLAIHPNLTAVFFDDPLDLSQAD